MKYLKIAIAVINAVVTVKKVIDFVDEIVVDDEETLNRPSNKK